MPKLMIIDDDIEMNDNLSILLSKEGYSVECLDRTKGAVEKLVEAQPDLLILDVMFPDNPAGGFDLARKIRMNRKIAKLPIILLTGVNQEFPMDFSSADLDPEWMPVQGFIEKPVDTKKLFAAIRKMLSGT